MEEGHGTIGRRCTPTLSPRGGPKARIFSFAKRAHYGDRLSRSGFDRERIRARWMQGWATLDITLFKCFPLMTAISCRQIRRSFILRSRGDTRQPNVSSIRHTTDCWEIIVLYVDDALGYCQIGLKRHGLIHIVICLKLAYARCQNDSLARSNLVNSPHCMGIISNSRVKQIHATFLTQSKRNLATC